MTTTFDWTTKRTMSERNGSGATLSAHEVRKLLRRFDKTFEPYRTMLVECYGADSALRIAQQARKEYADLLPRTPQFAGRINLFNWTMGMNAMIVALHRSMMTDGRRGEDTARILFAISEEAHRSIPGVFRWVAGRIFFSRAFLWLARRSATRVRDHPEGWMIDYQTGDGEACDWYFECSECGAVKYMRRHGAEELAAYCNYIDFIQSRAFGLGMQNPQNIGQGDSVCREYFKQGREASLPENLTSIAGPPPRDKQRE
jgi:hypothetical protein